MCSWFDMLFFVPAGQPTGCVAFFTFLPFTFSFLRMRRDTSTGGIVRRCECAADKARIFDDLLLGIAAEGRTDPDGILVYVGDSMTDLPALISADLGVVMGSNRLVRHVAAAAGVHIRPIVAYPASGSSPLLPEDRRQQPSQAQQRSPEDQRQQPSQAQQRSPGDQAAAVTRDVVEIEEEEEEELFSPGRSDPGASDSFSDGTGTPILYEATTWAEIDALLFGRRFKAPPPAPAPPFPFAQDAASASLLLSPIGGTSSRSLRMVSGSGDTSLSIAPPPRVLSIAGSDSGGGAGIQADIKTCAADGVYAATAVTALTVQDTYGVHAVHVPPSEFVRQQVRVVLEDIGADAIKTGMLPTVDVVQVVAEELATLAPSVPLVVDPVLVATSGDALAAGEVPRAVLELLFPLATVVTPNVPEASVLLGTFMLLFFVETLRMCFF
jgi:hypothetical protein